MQYLLGVTSTVFFILSTVIGAHACSASHSKPVGISSSLQTSDVPTVTSKPTPGG